jgi:hypothetical protein
MTLRKRIQLVERTLNRRPKVLSREDMTDNQLLAIAAEGIGLTREQWAALSGEELDALLDMVIQQQGQSHDDSQTIGTR